MFTLEKKFWDRLQKLHTNNTEEDMKNWLIKLHVHLEKRLKKISKNKMKKLHKLSGNSVIRKCEYAFSRASRYIYFFNDFSVYCDNFSPVIVNAANLATLQPHSHDISCISNLSEVSQQDCL